MGYGLSTHGHNHFPNELEFSVPGVQKPYWLLEAVEVTSGYLIISHYTPKNP